MTPHSSSKSPSAANRETPFEAIVGESAILRQSLTVARRISGGMFRTLLVTGEAGTGKELLARCMHYASPNAGTPFVPVNCAAIPEQMLEAELFGEAAGVSSGTGTHQGILELAGNGTVFLEEVAELTPALQLRLLEVAENGRARRRGALEEVTISCRIIAATRARLEERVSIGTFREDLFARLSMLRIDLPPLRDRGDDAHLVGEHILREFARVQGDSAKELTPAALSALRTHTWPGNVRELRNVLERAALLAEGPAIGAEHLMIQHRRSLPAAARTNVSFSEIRIPPRGKSLDQIEREALEITLQLTNSNQSAAARILGISRPTLARKLRAYGLMFESAPATE